MDSLTKNCIFSCKSAWEALRYRSNEVDWDAAIMPKHAFIFWLAIQDRLSTFDRLVKCGWQGKICCVDSAETSLNPGIAFSLNVPFQAGCGSK